MSAYYFVDLSTSASGSQYIDFRTHPILKAKNLTVSAVGLNTGTSPDASGVPYKIHLPFLDFTIYVRNQLTLSLPNASITSNTLTANNLYPIVVYNALTNVPVQTSTYTTANLILGLSWEQEE